MLFQDDSELVTKLKADIATLQRQKRNDAARLAAAEERARTALGQARQLRDEVVQLRPAGEALRTAVESGKHLSEEIASLKVSRLL